MLSAVHHAPLIVVVAIVATVAIVLIGLLVWGSWKPLVWRVLSSALGMGTGCWISLCGASLWRPCRRSHALAHLLESSPLVPGRWSVPSHSW